LYHSLAKVPGTKRIEGYADGPPHGRNVGFFVFRHVVQNDQALHQSNSEQVKTLAFFGLTHRNISGLLATVGLTKPFQQSVALHSAG
jgi:hypothetical protein